MTILPLEQRRTYFARFEAVLQREGLDYEVHTLPVAQTTDFEEYWIVNEEPPVKLFPAMVDPTAEALRDLGPLAAEAVAHHAAEAQDLAYYVVLCGAGWTLGQADAIRTQVAASTPIEVVVQTLEQFERTGV